MSKKKMKHIKNTLSKDERELGKTRIYIILAMIVLGLAFAIYNMQ